MKTRIVVLVAAITALGSAGALIASQQVPVFRAEANYVEVTVRVVDCQGRLVEGLTPADFEVREDSRPQHVEQAFRVSLPTPWQTSRVGPAALYRQELPTDLQVANGRIYLIYLNAVESDQILFTRKAAKDFVNAFLQPEDVVALWNQSRGLMMFTNDRERLTRGIDAFLGTNDAMTMPVPGTKEIGRVEPGLGSAMDWFSGVQGRRKSMILFSAGWSGLAPVFSENASAISTQSDLVDRIDVQIYIVDTRGLVAPAPMGATDANAASAAAVTTTRAQGIGQSVDSLRWLAEDAGGFAIVNHNTYRDGFKRIVEENSDYYVLGYQSTAKKRPNWEYREISVKVKKPGLGSVRVQARKGYVVR